MTASSLPRVRVLLPEQLRDFVDGAALVEVRADSVDAALRRLTERSPQLRFRLFADDGTLRDYVNVFVGPDEVRKLDGLGTPLDEGSELSIIPSIAGG
jgi:molybdopterin converting factor small subunit